MGWEDVLRNIDHGIAEAAKDLSASRAEVKPRRETVIGIDDLLNLAIALNTARTIEEFLELV